MAVVGWNGFDNNFRDIVAERQGDRRLLVWALAVGDFKVEVVTLLVQGPHPILSVLQVKGPEVQPSGFLTLCLFMAFV